MDKTKKLLTVEIIFLLFSVLIFRSLWLLIDRVPLMHKSLALWISLIISVAVAIAALRYLIKYGK